MKGPPEDSRDVGVDGGLGALEGEGGHGTGCVAPDSGEVEEPIGLGREASRTVADDLASQPVEVCRAAVVAEPIPVLAHGGGAGSRQRLQRGEALEKGVIVLLDPSHLGLLEHDLGDQDAIRIARPAPGEVASVPPKPSEQPPAKGNGVVGRPAAGEGRHGGQS